jgi:hypothetical protein
MESADQARRIPRSAGNTASPCQAAEALVADLDLQDFGDIEVARIGDLQRRRMGRLSQRWVVQARRIRLRRVMMASARSKNASMTFSRRS